MDRAGAVAALAAAVWLAAPAQAHPVQYPKTDALQISAQRVTLHIEYLLPSAEESALVFRLFDRDRSRTLDERESQALREYLCQQAGAFAAVELDGKPLPLGRARAELSMPGRGELLAVSLSLTAPLALTAGTHTLRLRDRHKDRALAVPVRVSAEGVRLTTTLPPLPMLTADKPLELGLVAR